MRFLKTLKESKIKFAQDKYPTFSIDQKLIDFIFWSANYNLAKAGLVAKLSIATFLKNSNKKSTEITFKVNENHNFCEKITEKRQKNSGFYRKIKKKIKKHQGQQRFYSLLD